MTYTLCKLLIEKGRYSYEDMFAKLDLFMMLSRISYEEYVELTGMLEPEQGEEPAEEADAE